MFHPYYQLLEQLGKAGMKAGPHKERAFQQKLASARACSEHNQGFLQGIGSLDPAGPGLQQTSTHLSKYWSDGGLSHFQVVKWHALSGGREAEGWEGLSCWQDNRKSLPTAEFCSAVSHAKRVRCVISSTPDVHIL